MEILDNARKKIGGSPPPRFTQIAEAVKDEYVSLRAVKIDETVLRATLGPDYTRFAQRGVSLPAYLQPQPQVYQQIFMLTQQYNLGVDFLVAGIDDFGGHISVITNPGTSLSLDKLGYGSVGSGGMHAAIHLSLHGQMTHKQLVQTLYDVYAAKKIAEIAPGVGIATDLAIVDSTGVWDCTEPLIKALQETFDESGKKITPKLDKLEKIYSEQHKP